MFLTLRNEKTLKKMRSKTLKNNIFFILDRNLIIRSFEIPHSIWKLHKDFKSVFVFKFRQKTKKFTPKWQKPLFEKRVIEGHAEQGGGQEERSFEEKEVGFCNIRPSQQQVGLQSIYQGHQELSGKSDENKS